MRATVLSDPLHGFAGAAVEHRHVVPGAGQVAAIGPPIAPQADESTRCEGINS